MTYDWERNERDGRFMNSQPSRYSPLSFPYFWRPLIC